jgi:hypothetical protein
MTTATKTTNGHPTKKLSYKKAIRYVEDWLTKSKLLTSDARGKGWTAKIEDYLDGDKAALAGRPWVGIRVSEVDVNGPTEHGYAGSAWMQVEAPWGIAMCGLVERCLLALVEGWSEEPYHYGDDGEPYYEIDEEFWRLADLIEQMNEPKAAS